VVAFKGSILTVTLAAMCVTDLRNGQPRKSASIPGRCKNFSFLLKCRGRFRPSPNPKKSKREAQSVFQKLKRPWWGGNRSPS